MSELDPIKEFFNRHEAGIAKGLLEHQGIRSVISADDCGGLRPHLALGMGGVRLLVKKEDVEEALEVLKVMDEPFDNDGNTNTEQ